MNSFLKILDEFWPVWQPMPSSGTKSMSGKCLVSNSCCKAAATVMFSLVTALSTVSLPSINKSMKLSIG